MRTCGMAMERLEERTLLSSISGLVFNDFNRNGVRDAGEKLVVGADVMLNGPSPRGDRFLQQEVFALHRRFKFDSLPAGRYQLTAIARTDLERTFTVNVEEGEDKTINLPLRVPTVISGRVDRQWKGQIVPVGRVKVYLDRNDNGRRDPGEEETRVPPIRQCVGNVCFLNGAYEFDHVQSGKFAVRLEGIGPHLRVISKTRKGVAQRGQTIVIEPIILRRKPSEDQGDVFPLWIRRG